MAMGKTFDLVKNKTMNKEKIIAVFKVHPSCDTLYLTTDNIIFTQKHNAEQHAKTLGTTKEKQKVTPVTRDEYLREANYPEGEPNEDWRKAELQAYMDDLQIEYGKNDTNAELLAKIEKA